MKYNAPRRQKAPPPGMRPASLAEPQGTQVVLQRHVAEQVLYAPVADSRRSHAADGGPVGRAEDPWHAASCRS